MLEKFPAHSLYLFLVQLGISLESQVLYMQLFIIIYFIKFDIFLDILTSLTVFFNTYPGLARFWYGTRLVYTISDPKYFEIMLPNNLKKEPLYHHSVILVGQGLFTNPGNSVLTFYLLNCFSCGNCIILINFISVLL